MTLLTFQAMVGDLRTGKITTRLPLAGASWQQTPFIGAGTMTGAGTITGVTINLADQALTGVDVYHATAPAKSFLGIAYGATILGAGPIWTRHYNRATAVLTLGAAGLPSLFDHRLVLPVLTQPVTPGAAQAAVTTYPTSSNMSLADIAAALVQQALADTGGTLPLVLPAAQGATPGNTRTYNGYDLPILGSMLTELAGVINGPEMRYTPQFNPADPTSIQWVMQAGTPAQPQLVQTGVDVIFDMAAPQSWVTDLDIDEDATTMGTRAWEVGTGSQAGVVLGEADSTVLTAAGYPLLEVVGRNHNSDSNQTDMTSYAQQSLTASNRPGAVWKLKIRNDGVPALGSFQVGDWAQIKVGIDRFLTPGTRRSRILAVEGDIEPGLEYTVTLAAQAAEV